MCFVQLWQVKTAWDPIFSSLSNKTDAFEKAEIPENTTCCGFKDPYKVGPLLVIDGVSYFHPYFNGRKKSMGWGYFTPIKTGPRYFQRITGGTTC